MDAVDRREWCAARGLAKPGTRGRFSAAAWDAMDEAQRNGTIFIDSKSVTANVVVTNEDGEKVTEKRELNPWANHPDPIRTEARYAFKHKDGSEEMVSVKEACHSCQHSFGWCYCDVPTFLDWRTGEVMTIA